MCFLQLIGSAIFVATGQNIFANQLTQGLAENVLGPDPDIFLKSGATTLQENVP